MKRAYVRPTMVGERFVANEYVAACHDKNTVYKFNCNARGGFLYYYPESDGTIDGSYNGEGQPEYLGLYHPCSAKHETTSTMNVFYDGFVDRNLNRKPEENERVIVWRGLNNRNGHATSELNMKTWETAKS